MLFTSMFVRVVPQSEFWARSTLVYNSMLLGTFAGLISLLAGFIIDLFSRYARWLGSLSFFLVCSVFVTSGVSIVAMYIYRHQIVTNSRAATAGAAAGTGLAMLEFSLAVLSAAIGTRPNWLILLGIALAGVVVYLLGARMVWAWIRRAAVRIVVQDGSRCPTCGYLLLGNTSMKCPECGRLYTYEDLGTTETEFRRMSRLACAPIE